MLKRVLVTGGAGFIGSHLCTVLLSIDGIEKVVAADNFLLGTRSNVAHLSGNIKFSLIEGDVNDPTVLDQIFKDYSIDAVFHLAANSDISISHTSPSVDFDATFLTTWNVLEAMRKNDCKQLIMASTSAIYGDTTESITEDMGPLHPISHYGAAKLASEAFISSFSYNYKIKTWIFRFPNVVGGRSTHGVLYDFLNKLDADPINLNVLGDGKQEKSYLHVSDLIGAIIHCYRNFKDEFNVFNVGGIDTITVKRIAEIVIEENGSKQTINYSGGSRGWIGDVPKFKYNIDKVLKTGWKPLFNSEQAVRRSVQELIKDREKNDN